MNNQANQYSSPVSHNDTFPGPGYPSNYGYTTPGSLIQEPWAVTQWTEYYVPTVGAARSQRPVIYVAAPLPAPSPCGACGGGFPAFG